MSDTLLAKVKGFVINPVETFQQTRGDEPQAVFIYFAVIIFVFSLCVGIATKTEAESIVADILGNLEGIFFIFFVSFIATIIATIIFVIWLDLWVYILGGRNGAIQTLKAVVYGSTPIFLLGWIPTYGIVFSIWSLVLYFLGVHELQKLSTARTVAVFVMAIGIPVIVIVLLMTGDISIETWL